MKMQELLHSEAVWTNGITAIDANSKWVTYYDPTAVKYDLLSALYLCYSSNPVMLPIIGRSMQDYVVYRLGKDYSSLLYFNQASTFDVIKKMLEDLNI